MEKCNHSWGLINFNEDKTRQVRMCSQCYKHESLAINIETGERVWLNGIRYNQSDVLAEHRDLYESKIRDLILKGVDYIEIMDNYMNFLESFVVHELYNKVKTEIRMETKTVCAICKIVIEDADTIHTCKKADGDYQNLCDDCWSKYTKDEEDETNLMKDKFDLFEDRTISLLERWKKFRNSNKDRRDIDVDCIKGFLSELDDDFTAELIKSELTDDEREEKRKLLEFRIKQSKDFAERK